MVEIAMTGLGGGAVGAAVGGFVTLATNPLQKLGMTWLVAGTEAVSASFDLLEESAAALGFPEVRAVVLFWSVVAATGAAGAVGGFWAWWVSGRVVQRIGVRE